MRSRYTPVIKTLVFLLLLLPAARLGLQTFQSLRGTGDGLGVNPIETLTHRTGDWTIYCLLLGLLITPLRRITRQAWLIKLRRMLGLFAFFYGCLHFSVYCFDQVAVQGDSLRFDLVLKDVAKRPYITVGTLALLSMVPLAATSTAWAIRKLGRRWQTLHRLVYATAILGIIHWTWLVKADTRRPLFFGLLLFFLLGARFLFWIRDQRASRA
ncbi:MAG: protein-methionine-sulfoxide reductase heme-binding subunit MsrQ [Polyangia bacterium]